MNLTVQTTLRKDENLILSKEPKEPDTPKDPYITYWRIGKIMPYIKLSDRDSSGQLAESDCTIEAISNLSKTASWFFWKLCSVRNEQSNIAEFTPKDNTEAKKVTKAYKELNQLQLIVRTRRQQYLCNPEVFIPRPGYLTPVRDAWENTK